MATLLTLKEFLAQNRISRATFYRLPEKPRLVRLGRRVLIQPEDADAWQRRMAGDARCASLLSATGSSRRSPNS